ncbi:glycosyltransferase family 2 protein [Chryseobacterium tongliaoense]|uniref:glycosyltransferase family 2 protein n=1 Tax=Chryseobacterium tongliaoense TaxID=3240933 RepID=UPI0035114DBD
MEQPLVTVVVVSYNHAGYIKECLDSIKNQTYKNIQLIVGDDASPDNSVEVFEQWLLENNYPAEKNFHSKNTGLAEMLNECIQLTKGKYIKLIAADDYLHPEFLEKTVHTLENKDETFAVAFSGAYIVNEDKSVIEYYGNFDFYKDEYQFRKLERTRNFVPGLSALIKTKALIETGPYNKEILLEDYDKWLKINENYFFAFIPENLAYYRRHEENISKIKARLVFVEEILLKLKYDPDLENKSETNKSVKKIYLTSTDKQELKNVFEKYNQYKGKEPWLNFCLKYRLPVKLYHLKYKFF